MNAPFIGRAAELGRLAELQERAHVARRPAVALIAGEPGSGKSHLLAEVLERSRMPHGRLVGFEPLQPIPLAAAAGVLRLLTRVPGFGQDLERLVFGEGSAESRDPLRIFEGAYRALASARPMLLAVDDLQWLDSLSLGLVHYLLQAASASGLGLVVVAAARPSANAETFAAAIEAIVPAERRDVIELGPLAEEEGISLVQALDGSFGDAQAVDLWRRARGSPFWLQALVLGDSTADPAGMIQDRFRSLTADAAALLAALAIGGRPLATDDLATVLEWQADRVRHVARELTARGLAVEAAGDLRTGHDLIREATMAGIPASTSRRLHERLAELLEREPGSDVRLLRESLEHRAAASLPTTDLALRILASPGRRLLGKDGLRVLASIADGTPTGSADQIALDAALGDLAGSLGEQQLAIERWARVSQFAPDVHERQHAELEAARAAYLAREGSQAHAHLDHARRLGTATPETAIRLDTLEADISLWLDHRTDVGGRKATDALAKADDLAGATGGPARLSRTLRPVYLSALHTAIDAAMQEDRGDEVIRLSEIGFHLARDLDDEPRVGSLLRIGFALLPFGRLHEAEASLREAWETARRLVMPIATVEAGNGLARVLPMLGRYGEARAVALEARELEARLGSAPRRWGNPAPWLHVIELSAGDPAAALRALREDAEVEVDPHFRLRIRQNIAAWQARFGGARLGDDVQAELTAARADAELAACPRCWSELMVTAGELLARVGRVEDAKEAMTAWRERSAGPGYPLRELRRTRSEAAIALAEGRTRDAASILHAAGLAFEREGLIEDLLWTRLDLGRALADVDRTGAVRAFTAAAGLANELGARSQERLAERELRQLGVRTWRRGPRGAAPDLAGLSARESEVARLAAEGASNREIADSLEISPRTVERHVTNVLAKLGLRNRTELSKVVHSAGPVRGSTDDRGGARS